MLACLVLGSFVFAGFVGWWFSWFRLVGSCALGSIGLVDFYCGCFVGLW